MMALWNLFYFIVALGILVTIHEYGHFWVARKLGVKVLTFSIGFGSPLWQRKGKDGVNYIIAAIPLGGYVKMLDEREQKVDEAERASAFNQKSVWARMAIVLAGPLANFVLAIALYWLMFVLGISGLSTQMGQIEPTSIAGKAGLVADDVIMAVDNEPVFLLQDVLQTVAKRLGEKDELQLSVKRAGAEREVNLALSLQQWQVDSAEPKILESLGIRHKIDDLVVSARIDTVEKGSPADIGGIKTGDLITKYAGVVIDDWRQLVKLIALDAGKQIEIIVERDEELMTLNVVIGSRERKGETQGFIGVSRAALDRSPYIVSRQGQFWEAGSLAVSETGKMISLTTQLFKKLLIGDISPKSLSGPISIAKGAGGSASAGLVYFISFVAMISVNLGFINLLPIPLLDGGHLLYFSVEAIRGRPLSEKIQELGMQIGMIMVFALMAIAIFNDLTRW